MGHLTLFAGNGVGERRREAGNAVTVDVGVRLAPPNGIDQRWCDRVLAVAGGRRYSQVDLPSSVPTWLLVVGDVDDAGLYESVDVAVGSALGDFEVVLQFKSGADEALSAFDGVFLDESRCNECFDVVDCDTERSYQVLDRRETSRTIYTLRREIEKCHSVLHFVLDHVRKGTVFESRRVGDEYRWRVLFPGDYPIGDVYDTMESHLHDGVSLSVSHITSAGNWNATERIATDFSPEHWRVLKAAVTLGYYERPREVSISDLASILDEPRSTVQYRLRTAEDRIVSQFVEQTL